MKWAFMSLWYLRSAMLLQLNADLWTYNQLSCKREAHENRNQTNEWLRYTTMHQGMSTAFRIILIICFYTKLSFAFANGQLIQQEKHQRVVEKSRSEINMLICSFIYVLLQLSTYNHQRTICPSQNYKLYAIVYLLDSILEQLPLSAFSRIS